MTTCVYVYNINLLEWEANHQNNSNLSCAHTFESCSNRMLSINNCAFRCFEFHHVFFYLWNCSHFLCYELNCLFIVVWIISCSVFVVHFYSISYENNCKNYSTFGSTDHTDNAQDTDRTMCTVYIVNFHRLSAQKKTHTHTNVHVQPSEFVLSSGSAASISRCRAL